VSCERFDPERPASDAQRQLLRKLSPDHPRLHDMHLSANEAWKLAGEHFECEGPDATILAFFGESPESHNQTTGEERVQELLSNSDNTARWHAHPKPDEQTLDAIDLALDSVEKWGIDHGVFYLEHMIDFDVRKAFRFSAEIAADHLHRAGITHMGTFRKLLRIEFTEILKLCRDQPQALRPQ
jgi:hypothetical protein